MPPSSRMTIFVINDIDKVSCINLFFYKHLILLPCHKTPIIFLFQIAICGLPYY